MRARPEELETQLARGLAPVYLLSGDEPLQMSECADAVRHAARQAGFNEREVLEAEARFDWNQLAAEADAFSLFADKKILDVRIPSGKPGTDGGAALRDYCQRPPDDKLLLLTLPRLDKRQLATAWAKAIDQIGVVVQIWPPDQARLPDWVAQRMRRLGLHPSPDAAALLAERSEGNLLAADQEIRKLALLLPSGQVDGEAVMAAVADSARYDVFDLMDAVFGRQAKRAVHILGGLQAEGVASAVVVWALARDTRLLVAAHRMQAQGTPPSQAVQQAAFELKTAMPPRQLRLREQGLRLPLGLWRGALRRCLAVDAASKGQSEDDPWRLLEDTLWSLATGRRLTAI